MDEDREWNNGSGPTYYSFFIKETYTLYTNGLYFF